MDELKSFHSKINYKQHDMLNKMSYLTKKSISAILREAIDKYLEEHKKVLNQKIG